MKLHDGEGTLANLKSSLKLLSNYLYQHYHKKTIILIDELKSSTRFGFTYNEVEALCDYDLINDKIDIIKE